MQLQLSTWQDVEAYLGTSRGIIIPIGSTEQHGPNGYIGTDALCPEGIAHAVGDEGGFLIAPTFSVGMAQHHMGFAGTITLRPQTMISALCDWVNSLAVHGFERFYFLNGHGGNCATIEAAFSQIYAERSLSPHSNRPSLRCRLRNWWELPSVAVLRKKLYGAREGSHATPSEVSLTFHLFPEHRKMAAMTPQIAPQGNFTDAQDFRRVFPDGRMGSDPSLANPQDGEQLLMAAKRDVVADYNAFVAEM
jgi:creatinine amidohydrolase